MTYKSKNSSIMATMDTRVTLQKTSYTSMLVVKNHFIIDKIITRLTTTTRLLIHTSNQSTNITLMWVNITTMMKTRRAWHYLMINIIINTNTIVNLLGNRIIRHIIANTTQLIT